MSQENVDIARRTVDCASRGEKCEVAHTRLAPYRYRMYARAKVLE